MIQTCIFFIEQQSTTGPIDLRGQAQIFQRLDNAINWISHYPVDKCQQNKPRYPPDSDLSGG